MRYRTIIPALLAAGMIYVSHLEAANAYFTTYVTAKGGYEIAWHKEMIKEEFSDWTKTITISSAQDSIPVYVRAKAFSGSKYKLTYTGEDWTCREDGYYYYNAALKGGETTTPLYVKISDIPEKPENNENFNVVVIYETVPVSYDEEGNMITPEHADWSKLLTSKVDNHDMNSQGENANE